MPRIVIRDWYGMIEWPLKNIKPILSEKDEKQASLKDFHSPFPYDGRPMSLTEIVL